MYKIYNSLGLIKFVVGESDPTRVFAVEYDFLVDQTLSSNPNKLLRTYL